MSPEMRNLPDAQFFTHAQCIRRGAAFLEYISEVLVPRSPLARRGDEIQSPQNFVQ